MSTTQTLPKGGLYKHFKGGTYFVLGSARSSENPEQQLVIYANADGETWARPLEDWLEEVQDPDDPASKVPRFRPLD